MLVSTPVAVSVVVSVVVEISHACNALKYIPEITFFFSLQQLEADLAVHTDKMKSLVSKAKQLIEDGHFDSATIRKQHQKLEKQYVI